MSYLCIRKQDPTAGTKGIMCGGVFLPVENYEAGAPTPAEQIPTDGLVFYLPCDSDDYTTAQTGQSLTKTGTVTAKTVDGIPCLEITRGSYLTGTLDGFSGDVSMAMSFWFKRLDSNSSAYITAGRGNYSLSGGDEIWASVESDHIETACGSSNSDARRAGILYSNIGTDWRHGYFCYDATIKKFKTVLDGDTEGAAYSAERSYSFQSGLNFCINSLVRATYAIRGNANYSRIRIFNRALTDTEIQALAREFVFNKVPSVGRKGIMIPTGQSMTVEHNPSKSLFIPLRTESGSPVVGQKGIIVRSTAAGVGNLFIAVKEPPALPEDGLVFYAPLEEEASSADTGQALTVANGTPVYTTYKGVPCAKMEATRIDFPTTGFPATTFTISAWYYKVSGSGYRSFFGWGYDSPYKACVLQDHDGKLAVERANGREDTTFTLSGWVCCTMTYNKGTCNIYANGKLVKTFTMTLYLSSTNNNGTIGGWIANTFSEGSCNAYIAACRIYNRAISASEITALANEFTPEA